MQPRRALAIVLRQFYLFRGSPPRVLPLFAWVAIDIVLWGFITRYLNTVARAGFNFVPALLGAVLLWDFFTRVMQGVTMAFFEDVWSRNFLNIFATPLSISEYLSGLVLTSIATSIVGPGRDAGAGHRRVRVVASSAYGAALAPFLLVLFLFGIALGIFGVRARAAAGPGRGVVHLADPGLLSPFAGVFYPLSTLPRWMQVVSRALAAVLCLRGYARESCADGARRRCRWRLERRSRSFTCWSRVCCSHASTATPSAPA